MSLRVPEEYKCPITKEIMVDPVIDPDGNSYEREAIMNWLQRGQISPITRHLLLPTQLAPNRALKSIIEAFKNNHRGETKMAIELEDFQMLEEVWKRSKYAADSFNHYITTNTVETLNWSVPWFSYQQGSWNIVHNVEYNFVVKLQREPKCTVEVFEVFRRTYSIRQNIHELIMNRGLWRSYREKIVQKAVFSLSKLKEAKAKITDDTWLSLVEKALAVAENSVEVLKFIEQKNADGVWY